MRERWWTAPEFSSWAAGGLDRLDAWVEATREAATLSSDRQSAAVLWTPPSGGGGEAGARPAGPLLVKWRHVRAGRHARTWLRASHERREAHAMRRAARRGVATPSPLAVAERRLGGVLLAAMLIRPFRRDARSARDLLAEAADPGLPERLGRALGIWHALGFRHGNAYPKNVLVPTATPDAGTSSALVPIGFPAARFVRPGDPTDRARCKDLAQMLVGIEDAVPGWDAGPFWRAYAPNGAPQGLARGAARLAAVLRARKAARHATVARREPHGPPRPTPIPPAPAVRVRRGGFPDLAEA